MSLEIVIADPLLKKNAMQFHMGTLTFITIRRSIYFIDKILLDQF